MDKLPDFAWGSCQYQTHAELFHLAKKYGFKEACARLVKEGFTIDEDMSEINTEMVEALDDNTLGKMFDAWCHSAKDLWYALSMAEDMLFKFGFDICDANGKELDSDSPVRQSLVALLAYETGCIANEEHFIGFAT